MKLHVEELIDIVSALKSQEARDPGEDYHDLIKKLVEFNEGLKVEDDGAVLLTKTLLIDVLKLVHNLSCQVAWAQNKLNSLASRAARDAQDVNDDSERLTPEDEVEKIVNAINPSLW